MLDIVIKEIISRLEPLKSLYNEIEPIINDLEKHEFEKFNSFVAKYYQNVFCSQDFENFIDLLVKKNLIKKETYLELFKEKNFYELLNFNYPNDFFYNSSTPLNVTIDKLNNIKRRNGFQNVSNNNENDFELLVLDDEEIELIRKRLLEAQLNYLNKPTEFIKNLENMNENEIYNSLLNLGNITYIQHSLLNLSIETLERLLDFIVLKEENDHDLINCFIEESIKRNLHLKRNNLKSENK